MRRAVIALACVCALSAPAHAFDCKYDKDNPSVSLYWPTRTLTYGVVASSGLDPAMVQAAMHSWVGWDCTDLELEYVGLVAESDPVSHVTVVRTGWVADGRPASAVAVTNTFYTPFTGVIGGANIEVNEDLFEFTADAEQTCDGTQYDLPSVITHEAGHFVGLGHTKLFNNAPTDPTMAPQVGACETYMRSLADDDLAGLCNLYPAGEPAGRCGGLPDDARVLGNQPFSCVVGPSPGEAGLWLALAGALVGLGPRRRRAGLAKTCPRVRSGG
ncbi:MAG: matrixin family metalloprotease [Myxococcales bacterium]|nr:matrixin family metalloprotease [Myxococcales bacterium]MCB9651166.1 matrixin family metalloprotease [Deltaproteobacteria bacterium]